MKTISTLFAAAFLFTGCFSKGNVAKVSTSSAYHKGTPLKVLILPLVAEGNPDLTTNSAYSEALAATLMDLGMRPIDVSIAKAQAASLDSLNGTEDVTKLAAVLGADAVLVGVVHYDFVPPSSGSTAPSAQVTTNKKGKQEVTIDGGSSYSTGGFFAENSLNIRIVDVHTSETI
ncbi:MAG TPA: hypothetical protein VFO76_06190, partial [Candidatus Kapabacteria bacterium]|nr:hypothetical protein [Candidatus Kapabacteria bacterium]